MSGVEGASAVTGGTYAFPLTYAQRQLWFLNELDPGNVSYNIPWSIRITGDLHVQALERSLNEIVRRHEILRTTFVAVDGEPRQIVAERLTIPLPVTSLDHLAPCDREATARRLAADEARQPFNLANGPLLQAQLIRFAPTNHVLLLALHHIIFDGWSRPIFARELAALYEAFRHDQPSPLLAPSLQYADYAVWQREYLNGGNLEKDLAYWKQQLAGAPNSLELATDHPRPAIQTFNGAATPIAFSRELSESLAALSRKRGASLFMTLLAGFQALLSRYTGHYDIVVGTPVANRNRKEIEGIIGLFANTLILRTDLSGDPDFGEVVERVRKNALKAYTHQELPFEKLVEEMNPERSLSHNPLYQIMFLLQNARSEAFELSGLELRVLGGTITTAKFDISVFLSETAKGLLGRIEYKTDLFDAGTIERMAGHYRTLLEGAVENPGLRLSELPLLTPAERGQIVDEWNATEAEYPRQLCLHEMFEQQAAQTPGAVACLFGESQLSYAELNARANQLAHWLQRRGARRGRQVGIFLKRTPGLLVGLLGIQKSGAACVPIDPAFPISHICQVLEEAQLSALLTEPGLRASLPEALLPDVICVEGDCAAIAQEVETNPESGAGPADIACVIFTLGPTGRTKGVQMPHRALVNVLTSMARELGMGSADVFPALASHAFDMSIPELYLALITGGRVALGPDALAGDGKQLAAFLRASGATIVQATPTTWNALLEAGFNGQGLKRVVGGETLPPGLCARLLEAEPSLYHFYGPTETTVWSAFHHFRSALEPIVIGHPLANTRIYILDRHQQPVPVGVVGEVYIAGDGVAHGYLNQAELTAERFLADPFRAAQRMYRTGDLAKFLPGGQIQCLGRRYLSTGVLDSQFAYWKQQLTGAPASLHLPTDHPRTSFASFQGVQCQIVVPDAMRVGLTELSCKEGVTLFVALLAAFSVLLARYSGQDDIVVGTLVVGRNRLESEKLIGLFVNTLALRVVLPGNLTFRQLLHRVQEVVLSAHAHQDLPFEKLVEELEPERDLGRNPLFQVMLILQNVLPPNQKFTGAISPALPLPGETSKSDLTMVITEAAEGLWITFEYNRCLFEGSTIERMQEHLQTLLQAVINDSGQEIARIPLLSITELRQQIEEWNATEREYSRGACVQDLLTPIVQHTPRRTAVVCGRQQISYSKLNQRANRLARYLRKHGVQPGSLVAVFLPRSIDMVVALLSILKAGGAYVPLDPAHPRERSAFILGDAHISILLTQRSIGELLPIHGAKRIYLDDDWSEIGRERASELPRAVSPDDLAYVIFTSGSTGRPKGVEITHRNLVNFLQSMQREPGFSALDTLVAVTTLTFDIAGLELYLPLISGGKVVIASREESTYVDALRLLLERSQATVLQATPATWRMLVESGWKGDSQLRAFCGGEALSGDLAFELLPRCLELWNMYGPTETTIWSSIFKIESGVTGIVPIGRPIANTQFYILDKNQKPVPVGAPGELYIGGLGVARGYLNREDLTARNFVSDPFRQEGRMYRTGDQAKFLPDGNVQYLGRADDQLKVRGYRIEPAEIESALGQHPAVRDCVVVLREEPPGPRLVAYVVTRSPLNLLGEELGNHLKKTLPDYMVPSIFVKVDSLPLTPAGKIDRRSLPAPEPQPAWSSQRREPRDEFEIALLEIWKRLLDIANCGMTDNFFELGGHSLLLVRLSALIEKEFHQTVPLSFLFESATIEKIAAFLRDICPDKSGFFLPFNETGSGPAFFCVHSLVGDVISCRHLARFLDPGQRFYGIQMPPKLRTPEFTASVEAIARRYVTELLVFEQVGPYVLGGFSAGVPIALEMAQQLKKEGHDVALLVSIDAAPANTGGGSRRRSAGYYWKLLRNLPRWAADDLAFRFSWSNFFRRLIRKSSGFVKSIPVVGESQEEIAQHRAKVFVNAGAYSESTKAFMETLCLTLAKYVPKLYSGRVVLYKTRTEPLFRIRELDLKWKKIATNLEIVQVNGTHISVLEESNVGLLARDLNERLKECRQRALSQSETWKPEFRSEEPAGMELELLTEVERASPGRALQASGQSGGT